jgi:monoamine oxidase
VLKAAPGTRGAIRFTPALDAKAPAFQRILCGPVMKVMLCFRRAFWEEQAGGRLADASFFHAPGKAFPTLWTALPLRAPLLNAWAGGPAAARLCARSDEEIIQQALECVGTVFPGVSAEAELESAHCHNWSRDPLARAAYSYLAVGGGDARALLATPLGGTLFFAGEATDTTGEAATVTGALRSGARAALEVIRHLEENR